MEKMKTIVVTGGTRGVGMHLCDYFLTHNCQVVFTGTNEVSIKRAEEYFRTKHDKNNFLGIICDIQNYSDCTNLVEVAIEKFKKIDIFISNAGIDIEHQLFHALPIEEITKLININLQGTLNSSHAILNHYKTTRNGALYLMEGFGSDGRLQRGMTTYGASKYSIRYLSKSLAKEYCNTNIIIGNLSPGMVNTTLLTDSLNKLSPAERKKTIDMFNILADEPSTVANFLGEEILKNEKNNKKIHWLTPPKIIGRFITNIYKKRKIIDAHDFL